MKQFTVTSLLILCNFFASAEEIDWYITDFYPCHVIEGPNKGNGFCDTTLYRVMNQMTDIVHNIVPTTANKLHAEALKGTQFCTLTLLETPERKEYLAFSDPIMAVLPNGLIILRDDLRFEKFLDDQNRIRLSELVKDEKLIFGRQISRSYGSTIDALIDGEQAQFPKVVTERDVPYVDLLKAGRIDYAIGYPEDLMGHKVKIFGNQDIQFYSFTEDPNLHFPGFSCTKGNWGNKMIKKIDNAINMIGFDSLNQEYMKWLPESVKQYYVSMLPSSSSNLPTSK